MNVARALCSVAKTSYAMRWSTISKIRCVAFSTQAEPLTMPVSSIEERDFPEKIKSLVQEISKLNLLEVSDLNECLKKTLNIQAAPMMSMGAMPAASPKAEEEEEAPAKNIQTAFTVKLTKFEDTKKVALIKEVKTIVEGMNLVQAKKFVESVPQILKSNVTKDEAEKLKKSLEAVGASIEIE